MANADAAYQEKKRRMINILYGNKIEEMREYLNAGGDVDFSINGEETPLCMARSAEMAELLLDNGADIHYLGYRNRTPLICQATGANDERPEILKLLLSKDLSIVRDVDFYGENALHKCARTAYETSLQCAEILVAADPTLVNVRNNEGQTPLDLARRSKNVATQRIIELLRKAVPSRTIAKFVNNHAGVVRNMMWKPPNNKYSFGGPAYERLKTKYRPNSTPAPPSTPTGERKRKSRKSKNGKSRKSKTRRS
jgi:hypothetical protein